eukprot:TRINITY_DN3820_c0_g3_i1.p1 TRINITY_DN3820_c0_g3~~TRINITY_DN3820_c0_g3_i1.p1  ORF type:complete len:115 (-),score=8.33 TRINITY_DN3820_c0_g3_i1:452-796(-)
MKISSKTDHRFTSGIYLVERILQSPSNPLFERVSTEPRCSGRSEGIEPQRFQLSGKVPKSKGRNATFYFLGGATESRSRFRFVLEPLRIYLVQPPIQEKCSSNVVQGPNCRVLP